MKRLCYVLRRLTYILSVVTIVISMAAIANSQESSSKLSEKPLWGFIDNIGSDWVYGEDYMLPEDWQGSHVRNVVNRWGFRAESRRLLFSEKWGLQGEFLYSAHKGNEYPDHGQDTGFKEYGINLILKRYFFDDMFYIGWLAGLSYVDDLPNFENRDWPDRCLESNLGQSHWLGTWGPLVGKDWRIYQAWSLRTEVRLTHTSDPFRTDKGKNFLGWALGVTYHF